MKKILILIMLILGLYPKLEQNRWSIGVEKANAQTWGSETEEEYCNMCEEYEDAGYSTNSNSGSMFPPGSEGVGGVNGIITHFVNENGIEVMTLFRPFNDHGYYRSDLWYITMIRDFSDGWNNNGDDDPGDNRYFYYWGPVPRDSDDPDDTYYPPYDGNYWGWGYDPGGGNAPTQQEINVSYLINALHVLGSETALLTYITDIANADVIAAMKDFLIANGGNTSGNVEFVRWAVGYLDENQGALNLEDFKRDFLTRDAGIDVSDLGIDGSGQNMNYDIYFDDIDGEFKFIAKDDPNYSNVINNGTTALPTQFTPATTQLLRQMGKDKGWDIGVSTLEFNRRVGQAFQEATYKLYRSKLNPLQLPKVTYQPQNNVSTWRIGKAGNSGQVIPDWTFDVSYGLSSLSLPQHMFYDAKAVNGPLYLSSSKYQIGGYIDVLSKKRVLNAPPPALVFVTPVNTIISPSILATAISKGVQIRQAFIIIINNKLYLLNSIEITPANDRFYNMPSNILKIIAGPVDLEYPINPNNGPDYEELQQ